MNIDIEEVTRKENFKHQTIKKLRIKRKLILVTKIRIFLFGLFSNLRVDLVGSIPINEFIAVINSLSLKYWKKVFNNRELRKINIAFIVFFLAQVVSDLVNHSTFNNAIRGWANILMAIVVFSFLANQLNRSKSILIFLLVGQTISLMVFDPFIEGITSSDQMSYFKFFIAPIVNNILLIISYLLLKRNKRYTNFIVFLFVLYGLICLFLDSRTNGSFMILTGLVLLNRNKTHKIKSSNILIFSLFFLIIFQIFYMFYVSQVLAGNFGGEHARTQLVRVENPYNPLNLLESGRSEVVVAIYAIIDKPIFGHGSWAPDPGGKYTAMLFDIHKEIERFNEFYNNSGQILIPSHSVIFGAWLSAGVIGFLAVVYIFIFFIKRSIRLIKNPIIMNDSLAPILIFIVVSGVWTFFFSALPSIRQPISMILALIIVLDKKLFISNVLNKKNNILR